MAGLAGGGQVGRGNVARRLSAKGDYSKASRVIETAWKLLPHPDLAEAYLAVRHGDSSHDKLKRARHLAKFMPTSRESRLLIAKAALDAREFSLARQELEILVLEQPTARVCRLMAELEENESGNAGMMRKWLSRASIAPRDPAWVADGYVSENWGPVSPVSGRIDAFVWTTPPQSLESQVRASIDADRFAPPVEAPATVLTVEPAPVVEAVVPEVVVPEVVLPETVVPVVAEKPAADATPEAPKPQELLSHMPDDPGPRNPGAKAGKKWRLFN